MPEKSFERRLLRAIEAGRDAGGQGRQRRTSDGAVGPGSLSTASTITPSSISGSTCTTGGSMCCVAPSRSTSSTAATTRDRGKNPYSDAVPQDVFVAGSQAAPGGSTMTYSIIGRCARTWPLWPRHHDPSRWPSRTLRGDRRRHRRLQDAAFPNRTNDPLVIKLLAEGSCRRGSWRCFAGQRQRT